MKTRKIVSLTAALSFIFMVLTSFILYIVPQGRIAYWADWHLWGLTKEQWGNIHINTGILFLISLGFHVYYNWKAIIGYLKDRAKKLRVFTVNFNVALILTLAVVLGTYFRIPPLSSMLELNEKIKDHAAKKYGEPPYGHAELSSLKTFAAKMGVDINKSMEKLKQAGYEIEGHTQTLSDIARKNGVSPQIIYTAMKFEKINSIILTEKAGELPDSPPTGTGNMTLAELCCRFNLNMNEVIRGLKKQNVEASKALTIKKIGEKNKMSPIDVYEKIKIIASKQSRH